jgi:hypothetical protein
MSVNSAGEGTHEIAACIDAHSARRGGVESVWGVGACGSVRAEERPHHVIALVAHDWWRV